MDSLTAELWEDRQREDWGNGRLRSTEQEEQDAAFVSLVERQGRFLYRVAYSVLRNSHNAEDAVQETFLKLYRTGVWKGMQEERAYLACMVWRIAVERLPRQRISQAGDEVERLVSAAASPEECAVRSSEARRLRREIDRLPEELRQPLILSGLEEMNSREIGVVMGIPEGTVRTRLMRARAELRKRFEEGGRSDDERVRFQ